MAMFRRPKGSGGPPPPHRVLGEQFHSPAAEAGHAQEYWNQAQHGNGYFKHPSEESKLHAASSEYAAQLRGANATH
jgi:hypothetical protein